MPDSDNPRATGSTTGAGAPAPSDRNSLTHRRRTARSCCTTCISSSRWRISTAKRCRSASRTPRAPARSACSTSPKTFPPTPRPPCSRRVRRPTCSRASRPSPARSGSPDTWRDVRGFSLKFYTDEGNYDLVGNNTPVFFVRDPMKFPHFIRSQKRLPDSGLRDNHMQWDFWTNNPETAHQVTYLMGERGLPRTWRQHERLWLAHLYVDQRQGREVLGEVPLPHRSGHGVLQQRRGRRDGRQRRRFPPPRPVRGHRARRASELDAVGADHALCRRRRTIASTRST